MEKKQKKKSKFREIRSAVTMMCVMVAMMSTATYAWFTLTDSPTVAGLQMQAVSTGGLEVSLESADGFANAIEITDENTANLNGTANPLKLVPVTPGTTAGTFHLPVYEGGYVAGLDTNAITGADLGGKVAVYTYYIRSQDATDEKPVNVGIIVGDAGQTADPELSAAGVAQATGSFIRKDQQEGEATDMEPASYAIRVGFLVDNTFKIWEPNQDKSFTDITSAPLKDGVTIASPSVDVSSKVDGTIVTGGTGTESEALFSLGADVKKVEMYVWLEGTDTECADEIQADILEGQIQFTIVE